MNTLSAIEDIERLMNQTPKYQIISLVQRGIDYYRRNLLDVHLFKIVMSEAVMRDSEVDRPDFPGVELVISPEFHETPGISKREAIELHFSGLGDDIHIAIYPVPEHIMKNMGG